MWLRVSITPGSGRSVKQQCNLTRDGTQCWHTRLTINYGSGWLQPRTSSTPSRLHAWGEGDGQCGLGCGKRGWLLHTLCNCKVTMEEKEWRQGRINWHHDSVLFANSALRIPLLRCKNMHQQVKLGVSEQEVNKTVQFKSESNIK